METPTQKEKNETEKPGLFVNGKERLAIWHEIRGMWKDRDPDPIEWLEKSREDSERELPPLGS